MLVGMMPGAVPGVPEFQAPAGAVAPTPPANAAPPAPAEARKPADGAPETPQAPGEPVNRKFESALEFLESVKQGMDFFILNCSFPTYQYSASKKECIQSFWTS